MSEKNEMKIQWFPGHMTKTGRYIEKNISLVDIVLEVVDARIAHSSRNPDFDRLLSGKQRLIILTKIDLADSAVTNAWVAEYKKNNLPCIAVNCLTGWGINEIIPTVRQILKDKIDAAAVKGAKKMIRMMICGVPNSGKSTLINALCKKRVAKAQDRPGITRGGQWVTLHSGIELLDTPGILWNKFDNPVTGLYLAFTGAIRDVVVDIETLTLELIRILIERYPEGLCARYKLDDISGLEPIEVYEAICRRRGFVLKGNEIDYQRGANIIIDEFRAGLIGKISLEVPCDA